MIEVLSNGGEVLDALIGSFSEEISAERVVRAGAQGILPDLRTRIHVDGQDASGDAIGEYSEEYLDIREAANRGRDTAVILSLTRQMENDLSAFPTDVGWAIGYQNAFNANKARFNEERYGKVIFALSVEEEDRSVQIMNEEVEIMIKELDL